jgi:phage I-like protein
MAEVGYLIDLSTVTLSDEESMTSWIHLFPFGKYDHPRYGEIEFDAAKAKAAEENFKQNVRGTEIDIDYDHKAYSGEAAGWIRDVEARPNGLWGAVEWTKKAWKKIQDKEYKYFSPEFADEWKHPKDGKVVKNILFGGGITNRPFLKDILPLNMSELGMASERPQEGSNMDPEKIRELLGLPKDATDEQVETALTERKPEGEPQGNEGGDQNKEPEGTEGDGANKEPIAANEGLPPEVIQLAESNPAVKALVEQVTALGTSLHQTQAALHLSEVNQQVKRLTEGTSGQVLPAAVKDDLTKALLEPTVENFTKVLTEVQKTGLVQLGEIGVGGQAGAGDGMDSVKKFNDAVQKVIADDKLEYADAVTRVASLDPQLYNEYRENAYSFKTS